METYRVPPPNTTRTRSQKIWRVLYIAALYSTILFVVDRVLFHQFRSAIDAISIVFQGILFGLTFSWLVGEFSLPYQIVVGDQEMWGNTPLSKRTIHRGRVRKIVERRKNFWSSGGILVSERSRLGLYFWGGLWVPKSLPEFEHLRAIVESWRIDN